MVSKEAENIVPKLNIFSESFTIFYSLSRYIQNSSNYPLISKQGTEVKNFLILSPSLNIANYSRTLPLADLQSQNQNFFQLLEKLLNEELVPVD